MKKSIKLYNMILPIWLIWLFPPIILICILANTIIDGLVVFLSAKKLNTTNPKNIVKKSLFKVVLFGFLSDFIGSLILLFLSMSQTLNMKSEFLDNVISGYMSDPFSNIFSLIIVLICIAISGYFIYFFNSKYSFKNINIDEIQKKKISLYLAIFTAPYTFLIPTSSIWHWYH